MVCSLTCFRTVSYIYLFCTCSMHFGLVTITVRYFQGSFFEEWVPLIRRKHLFKKGVYMNVKRCPLGEGKRLYETQLLLGDIPYLIKALKT